jgi:PAS domain-containing protein
MYEEQGTVELRKAMEHFRARAPEILERWEETVRSTLPANWHADELILRDHVPEFLDELARAVLSGIEYQDAASGTDVASRVAKTLASSVASSVQHGGQRAILTDYTLGQLLHEYRILRKVSFDILDREAPRHPASREIVNDGIDRAMELAAVEFTRVQQEALALSEAQSRLVMENVHDYAIFMVDEQGKVLTWNDGAERLTGYRSEELIGKPLAALYEKPTASPAQVEEQIAGAT